MKKWFVIVLVALMLVGIGGLWLLTDRPVVLSPEASPLPLPAVTVVPHEESSLQHQSSAPTATPQTQAHSEDSPLRNPEDFIRRVFIPSIEVRAFVSPVSWQSDAEGDVVWDDPQAEIGWLKSSALPSDRRGSVVLYAHNNMYQAVFRDLGKIKPGDEIYLYTYDGRTWIYLVREVHIIRPEQDETDKLLQQLLTSPTPKLVLLSCWPPVSNLYRVVVVAYPQQMW